MPAYYNEIEPYAAAWLRNLIDAGHIAPGVVDERDIRDIRPADLDGYDQCHFFAGIGVWSRALRLAGWADDRPVWTGSCPCQPFSAAGRGDGFADERHLWPHWQWLLAECRPATVFGEQVASKDTGPWLDLVQDDLEGMGYAFGAVPVPAAGFGAPHIRDRLWWVADAAGARWERGRSGETGAGGQALDADRGLRATGVLADADSARPLPGAQGGLHRGEEGAGTRDVQLERLGDASGLADPDRATGREDPRGTPRDEDAHGRAGRDRVEPHRDNGPPSHGEDNTPSPTNGFWRDADWLLCRDGKWRPVEPGTFPLAHGVASRVGRLRAYGNAIVAPAAEAFIRAFLDSCGAGPVQPALTLPDPASLL